MAVIYVKYIFIKYFGLPTVFDVKYSPKHLLECGAILKKNLIQLTELLVDPNNKNIINIIVRQLLTSANKFFPFGKKK
jgi:hypothetical protein